MATILPIKDLRNTNEISELAHSKEEPIYITKNGYADLVVMSNEYYEQLSDVTSIDMAIDKAEDEYRRTGRATEAHEFFSRWESRHGRKV